MIKAARLPEPITRPKCEAKLMSAEAIAYNERQGFGSDCKNVARYEIAGRKLCGRHAGAIALSLLLEGKGPGR